MKTICVPKSYDAMNRFDFDACVEGDLVEIKLSIEEFKEICDSGLFDDLNRGLSIMIDDFEDEKIVGNAIDKAILILKVFIASEKAPQKSFLEILRLLELSKRNGTGVFFYF